VSETADIAGTTLATSDSSDIPHQRTAPRPPEPPRLNAATRHLCAGVYVDSAFRDRVLRDSYNDNKRRFAPSYGFDPIPVLRHAWRSWRLEITQHVVVTAILVVVLVWRPLIAVLVGGLALAWWAGHQLSALSYARWRYLLDRTGQLHGHDLDRHSKFFAVLTATGVAATGITAAILDAHHRGQPLLRGNLTEALVVLLAPITIAAGTAVARQYVLDRVMDEPEREQDSPLSGRLGTLAGTQAHGYTVYGGHRPFIGSGRRVRGWSFVQRLIPPAEVWAQFEPNSAARQTSEYAAPPFRTDQLVTHLHQQIQSLCDETDPEVRLPGLRVADHVFIEGTRARPFLAEFDANEADATQRVMTNPDDAARHYLACCIESWGGEVFTTVFVHASLQGRTLYLEFSTYALTPVCRAFQDIDSIGATGPGARWRAAWSSLRHTPGLLLAPVRLARALRLLGSAVGARHDLTREARRGVNIGARFSLREEAVWRPDQRDDDPGERARQEPDIDYFQLGDINKHSQILERRLLAAVADFLSTKKVDTSEFWQRATTILNNGVISNGSGNTIVNDSTVGPNATFTTNAPPAQ
jgi:hypothetical protein